MAVNSKRLLKAVLGVSAVFGAVAAFTGIVFGIVTAVEWLGLPNYVIPITIFGPMFVVAVVIFYKDLE
jgi:vacuolar-type H+-ATPase subunit I/STV1